MRVSKEPLIILRCPIMTVSSLLSQEGNSKQPKALQRISDALDSRIQDIMTYIMPRERVRLRFLLHAIYPGYCHAPHLAARCMLQGDARDWALMWTSIAIFVYTAMHAYRLYAHMYYSMGLRPILHTLAR